MKHPENRPVVKKSERQIVVDSKKVAKVRAFAFQDFWGTLRLLIRIAFKGKNKRGVFRNKPEVKKGVKLAA